MKSNYVYSIHSLFHRLDYQLPFRRNRPERANSDEIAKMLDSYNKFTGGIDINDQIRVPGLEPGVYLDEIFIFLCPSNSYLYFLENY